MEEKVLDVCKVTPLPGSSKEDIILPLTFFDLFNTIFPPVELLFFYETPSILPHHILLPKLKHSLSQTLAHFLPAAGYLVWPHSSSNPVIRYKNGDGVLFTVAQSDADFYHLSGRKIRDCTAFQPLIARLVRSGTHVYVPLMAFKITLFPNIGICIGVTVHHSLFDATSTTMFMNSWAFFFKFGKSRDLSEELTPDLNRKLSRERYSELERSCLKILNNNDVTSEKIWYISTPELALGIVRGTFVLSSSEVKKLKGLVNVHLEKNNNRHVSTFAVTYAYVILCLVKAKPPRNNLVNASFGYECRGRLDPPLPKNYFGNCVGTCDTNFNTELLLKREGMSLIVDFISKTTELLNNGGVLKGAEELLPSILRSVSDKETLRIFVMGSSRFEYQSVDFGWGRPRKADIASIDGTGGVTFTQRGDVSKGGIEVELSLNDCEMDKFASIFYQSIRNMETGL